MKKFNSYTFWISLLGAVIILINTLGSIFNFAVDEIAITSVVTAVLGIFVTLGLVKKDKSKTEEQSQSEQENIEQAEQNELLDEAEKNDSKDDGTE